MALVAEELAELARLPDSALPLERMAALISAEHQGKVRAEDISDAFNQLAEEFLGTHPNPADPATLTRFIHEVAGFRGNTDDYYDPANSYIDRVLSSKRGIPISLALVHLCLAERIGLEAWGINFPGHVLVGYQGLDQAYVDPFSGRYLSLSDCKTLFKQNLGPRQAFSDHYLSAASPRAFLLRLVENLKQVHWRLRDWSVVERCLIQQSTLTPEVRDWLLQRGIVREMRGDLAAASQFYQEVIETATEATLKETAIKRLTAMGASKSTLH